MSIKEKLQIFIITYNRKKYLYETLSQLLSESSPVKDCDITVLDNASTDGSQELSFEYDDYPNFKYIRNKINVGVSGNIIHAMELPDKEWFWIIGDDDKFDFSNWDEIQDALESDYDIVNVCSKENDYKVTDQKDRYARAFIAQFFLSAAIYRTKCLDENTIKFAYYLSQTLNSFNILGAEVINNSGKIYIPKKSLIIENTAKNYKPYVSENKKIPHEYSIYNYGYETFVLFSLIKDRDIRKKLYDELFSNKKIPEIFGQELGIYRFCIIFFSVDKELKYKIIKFLIEEKIKKFCNLFFSSTNYIQNNKKRKIITFLGIKFKFKLK